MTYCGEAAKSLSKVLSKLKHTHTLLWWQTNTILILVNVNLYSVHSHGSLDIDVRMCVYWNPGAQGSHRCSVPQLMRIIWPAPSPRGSSAHPHCAALWGRGAVRCHFWTQGSRKLRESARADNAPALTHTPSAEG